MILSISYLHHGIIERPRLLRLLDDADARLILMCAPAGYGKTTLARQWAVSYDGPVAWLVCRRGSADTAAIALGLIDSLEAAIGTRLGVVRERVRTSPNANREAVALAEVLAEHVGESPALLVLDDYQHLTREPAAEEFVEEFLAASGLNALVTTRSVPRWATARRILYGEILQVTAQHLAMTEGEAKAVFAVLGREATERDVSVGGGWPAVISLLARTPRLDNPIHGSLNDFLAQEVCRGLDGDVRDVLEVLAAMRPVSKSMLVTVAGRRLARRVVDEGLRRGILSETVHGEYDVHEVVRSFFEAQVIAGRNSDHLARLVERAGNGFIEAANWNHAFELATRFPSPELIDHLARQGLRLALDEGRTSAVRHWLEFVRASQIKMPVMMVAEAELAFREGAYLQAETIAASAIDSGGLDESEAYWAHLIAGRAAHLGGQEKRAIVHYRAGRASGESLSIEEARVAAWGELAVASDLELPETPELLSELDRSQLATPDDQLRLSCRSLVVGNRFGSLQALDQAHVAAQLVELVEDPYLRTSFRNVYGYLCAIAGDYARASDCVDALEGDAARLRLAFVTPYCALTRAVIAIGLRSFETAFECLDDARADGRRIGDVFVVASAEAIRARALISLGRFDEAASAASWDGGAVIRSMKGELLATRALARACEGRVDEAMDLVGEAEGLSAAVEIPILAGAARCIVASHSGAAEVSELALRVAAQCQTTRYVDGLIIAYRGYPELGRLIASDKRHRRWLRDLMRTSCDDDILSVVGLGALGGTQTSLSPREAEVFRLMRLGMSNREIGNTLFISEATVKLHAHHIYDKLGVRTRTEAVLKAPVIQ
jgi:DNA-binding NarL/FixJ family response regulator